MGKKILSHCQHPTTQSQKKLLKQAINIDNLVGVLKVVSGNLACQDITVLRCKDCLEKKLTDNPIVIDNLEKVWKGKIPCITGTFLALRNHLIYHQQHIDCANCNYVICKTHNTMIIVCNNPSTKKKEVIH